MKLRYHPQVFKWIHADLEDFDDEVLGDVVGLLGALETFGRDLDDDRREESHRVATSPWDLHALRRTPATMTTPYALDPPVIRILYCFCKEADEETALILIGGDKTEEGNQWYPPNIAEAHRRIREYTAKYPNVEALRKEGYQS